MSRNVLVLLRHGESEYNKKNLFTGWDDPDLTAKGREEAAQSGRRLAEQGFKFDVCFTSALKRTHETADIVLKSIGQESLPRISTQALNERDYGSLTGLNKDDARERWGEEQVTLWRRSYAVAPPDGESLEMTAKRVLPYYAAEIRPRVVQGEAVLVIAHGNSMRALVMDLEGMTGEEITQCELATGVLLYYELDMDGKVLDKKVL